MSDPGATSNLDTLLDLALQIGGETDGFDFKELLDFRRNGEHKVRLLKAIGAFGNTDKGGHIIIGVTDDRLVVGITPELASTYDQTPIQKLAGEYFAPPPTVQVRHHQRGGKQLVFIEVAPFREIPSIVKKYEVQGKEKLQDGTFLVRTGAAESALLTTEGELRKLCDAIAGRRARAITELVNRGTANDEDARQRSGALNGLKVVKAEADRMREHAQQLNIEIQKGFPAQYLPLLFRPSVMESALPQVIDHFRDSKVLETELGVLRTAAAAADEQTTRFLERGGELRGLVPLVLNVLHSATHVSREIERLLK